jgi:hypothetical protein
MDQKAFVCGPKHRLKAARKTVAESCRKRAKREIKNDESCSRLSQGHQRVGDT